MAISTSLLIVSALCIVLLSIALSSSHVPAFELASLPCIVLTIALGSDKAAYPTHQVYIDSQTSYFSQQANAIYPSCIITPRNTKDVSTAVKILSLFNRLSPGSWPFAIRGGGHTYFAGSSNIEGGVTIDMRSINDVSVSSDKATTSVGAGAVWGDVYRKLDALDLAVVGGRVSPVGVGGLITGGGVSFFSPRKGFACDNVVNYEIVLANGRIINVNENEHQDLWVALKGGSNNFGIVTRFDLKSFSQGKLWGGMIMYDISSAPQVLQAFSNFNEGPYDEYASLIQSFGFAGDKGYAIASNTMYTKPIANPPVYDAFKVFQPRFVDTLRVANLTDFTNEQAAFTPNGLRHFWITTTFKNDINHLIAIFDIWKSSTESVETVPDLSYSFVLQPLPPAITQKSRSVGGNSLGFDKSDEPLVLCLLTIMYTRSIDDALISSAGKELIDRINAEAQKRGLQNEFVYLNYAAAHQDPIRGYGVDSVEHLKTVSQIYDPKGLFQKAVPGGFKIFAA